MSKRAIIYARVSTDEQAESGYGLLYQVDRCKEYAERRSYDVVCEPITDDYTGKTAFRPGMNELLNLLGPLHADVVIVHRTDRLGRRATVQDMLEAEIEARGATVEYVTAQFDRTTAVGRAMRRIQGTFDQLDYETIVERLRDHKTEAAKRGSVVTSRSPYGYQVVKETVNGKKINKLEVIEEEAVIIRMVYQWYIYGDDRGQPLSIAEIATRLTAMHIPTRCDTANLQRRKHPAGTWNTSTLHNILKNETYIGQWHYKKRRKQQIADTIKEEWQPREQWIAISCPPIVGEETWQLVRARLQHNKEQARRNRKRDYLFSGMVTCARCERAATAYSVRGFQGYRCYRQLAYRGRCDMPVFAERRLDRAVWAWITEIVSDPEKVLHTTQERQAFAEQQNAHIHSMIAATDKLITVQRAEQERVMRLYRRGLLDEDRWYTEDQTCQQTILNYETERAELMKKLQAMPYTPEYFDDVRTACARIAYGMEQFTQKEKRHTYELLHLKLTLAIEEGMKVAYAECVLDTKRLLVSEQRDKLHSGHHDIMIF
jgi:site-specific DNA recombinase